MKVLSFILGLVAGAIGAVGLVIYLPLQKPPNEDSQIIFAAKNFLDSKQNNEFGYVAISGTLTGQDVGYSNNTYGLSCIKRFNACFAGNGRMANSLNWSNLPAPTNSHQHRRCGFSTSFYVC
jgi:hypothetical protein